MIQSIGRGTNARRHATTRKIERDASIIIQKTARGKLHRNRAYLIREQRKDVFQAPATDVKKADPEAPGGNPTNLRHGDQNAGKVTIKEVTATLSKGIQ